MGSAHRQAGHRDRLTRGPRGADGALPADGPSVISWPVKPPVIPVEVLPPEGPGNPPGGSPTPSAPPTTPAPFHPLAATLLVVIDNLWNLADWAVLSWAFTLPLSFLTVAIPTLVLQRRRRGDGWGRALAKAAFLGLLAAVPTSLTGTPVGLALLAWAGVRPGRPA